MIGTTERSRVAERLRKMRAFKRLSQEHVAREIGVSRAALSAIENGKRRVDSLELLALARLYRYPTGFFLGENPEYGAGRSRLEALLSELDESTQAEVYRFADYLKSIRTTGEPVAR